MMQFDRMVKKEYPIIYGKVTNRAVRMLRTSSFYLYPAAKTVFDISERWKSRWMH